MKRIYFLLIVLGTLLSLRSTAQNPCTGTPGSNSLVPGSQTICAGSTAYLGLANSYSNSGITFQWQSSPISIVGPWTNINGANTHAYTTPALNSTMYYNVVITCTNPGGGSISLSCSITVITCTNPCGGAPANNTIIPANHTVCIGNVASMGLANNYTNTGMTYQWGSSSSLGGPYTAISGATTNAFTSSAITTNTFYNIVITCTNSSLSYTTTHSVSAVSCTFCSGTPSSNSVLPLSHTICAGSVATMSLANSYSASGITYQWGSSNVSQVGPFSPINGATLTTYTTGPLNSTTYFNVVITCTNGGQFITVLHAVNVVTCNAACSGAPATTSILPLSHTLCAGDVATMSLSTTYTATGITYQWGSSPVPGGPFTPVSGATLSSYTSPTLGVNMYYNVVITCTNSNLTYTTTHSVSVVSCTYCSGAPGPNTVTPVSHTVCAGDPAIMNLANSYTASGITYQWQSSTTSIVGPFNSISGAMSSSYTSLPLNTTTYFNVIITCTNSGQSINVTHMVTVVSCTTPCSGPPASNTVLPLSHTVCVGSAASMNLANSYLFSGMTYQWGSSTVQAGPYTAIPGATLSNYTTPPLMSNMYYNVVITCTNSNLSYTATHVVTAIQCVSCSGPPTANNILPPTYTLCAGKSATMNLANTYTVSGISYQWQSSSSSSGPFTPISGATLTAYTTPTLASTMYYNVVITCTSGGSSTTPSLTVTVFNCSGVGLDHLTKLSDLKIFPNPNSGEFNVESSELATGEMILTDVLGRNVFIAGFSGGKTTVNIAALPNGIYYAHFKTISEVRVIKIIKE